MENHTDIETLLTKYFEGNTTPPENEQIEAWLNADEEHLRIAKQLNTLYLAVDTQHITKKIDTEKALDKVKSRTKVRNLSWWGWTQRIAAILSVPLLIGVLALYTDRQQPVVTAQMVEIKTNAGMTTSVLLPDSTVVHLNSESSLRYPTFCRRCTPSGINRCSLFRCDPTSPETIHRFHPSPFAGGSVRNKF